jgi:hypothetical protein
MLINTPIDLSFRANRKTVLYLTLENVRLIEVTRALLRFLEIYKDLRIDSEIFIYEDSRGRFISLDIYVELNYKYGDYF